MDELEIGGKKYISSKRAAELTGYAKDYVGQLARGGKIDATRIGRSWYVGKEAILALGGNDKTFSEVSDAPQFVASTATLAQEPKKNFLQSPRMITPLLLQSGITVIPDTWGPVRYFEENAVTFPILKEKSSPEITNQIIVFRPNAVTKPPENKRFTERAGSANMDGVVVKKTIDTLDRKNHTLKAYDGLVPKQKLKKPENPSIESLKVSESSVREDRRGVPAWIAVAPVLLMLGIAFAGSFLGSQWTITSTGLAATITAEVPADLAEQFNETFSTGFGAFKAFLDVIFSSFWTFFRSGVEFITNLF